MKSNRRIQPTIAASEVVGFVIILGIMSAGIGIVTLYGYPALNDAQENANTRNMERAMIVLQQEFDNLIYKSIPFEETTIQVSSGTLSVISPGTAYFSLWQDGTQVDLNPDTSTYDFYPGLIEFISSPPNAIIGLQNGAVVKNYFGREGSTMLSEPRWYLDFDQNGKRTLFLSFVQVSAPYQLATGGTVAVRMKIKPTNTIDSDMSSSSIKIKYSDNGTGFNTAWQNYFNDKSVFPSSECSVSGSTLTVEGVDRLVIKTYNVTIN